MRKPSNTLESNLQPKRKIRVKREARNTLDLTGLTLDAVERLIDHRVDTLQDQLKVLQSNAITTMVIFGDMRNSVALANSSSESTKKVLTELISNLDNSFSNIVEFIGSPHSVQDSTYDYEMSEGGPIPRVLMQGTHSEEQLSRLIQISRVEGVPHLGGVQDFAISEDGDDMVENVSEDYEDYGELDDDETEDIPSTRRTQARRRRI